MSTAWVSALSLRGGAGLQHSRNYWNNITMRPRNNARKCLSVNRDHRGPCKCRLGCVWNTSCTATTATRHKSGSSGMSCASFQGNSVYTIEIPAQYVIQRKPNYQWKHHPGNAISTKSQFDVLSCPVIQLYFFRFCPFVSARPLILLLLLTVVSPAPRLPLLPRSRPVRHWARVANKVH